MELLEKIEFCSGKDYWHTKESIKNNIKSVTMSDGPNGLRKQGEKSDNLGLNGSFPATCLPSESTLASSFDENVCYQYGELIGTEARANNVDTVLGPGVNIKRNPLCGRNFEYLSEDPYLSGKLAASYIKGVQSTNTGSCIKHFACNSQEYMRMTSNSLIDERTLREIYLTAFEIAIKESKPEMVMGAYNKLNNFYCCSNEYLLNKVLRDEWNYDGVVVTDWGALANRADSFKAGCDLIMPGGSAFQEKEVLKLVTNNELDKDYIDKSYNRVLNYVQKHQNDLSRYTCDYGMHHKIAQKIAEESAVLLSNKENILPLSNFNDVCIIGEMARNIRYQGAGSSKINPIKLEQIVDVLSDVEFAQGYDENGNTNDDLISNALKLANKKDKVVLFLGLPSSYESEGFDRENISLPQGEIELLNNLLKVNKNIIVVLFSGGVVRLDFKDQVKAILYMGLPGQAGARACVNLLSGKAVPSGRLAETWPLSYDDVVCKDYYGKTANQKDAQYREGIYVGYRYYDKANIQVQFPFGFGLSYSKFEYSSLKIDKDNKVVSIVVKNIGNYKAKETVLLYISSINQNQYRPLKELKRFKKVELEPNESITVFFDLNDRCFSIWDSGWKTIKGEYKIIINELAENICIEGDTIKNEEISNWYFSLEGKPTEDDFKSLYKEPLFINKEKEFTINSTFSEMMKKSLLLRIIYRIFEIILAIFVPKESENYKGIIIMAYECPVRVMRHFAQTKIDIDEMLCNWANKKRFDAIKILFKKQ